eukprot:3408207-Karenia_brevis.AAC.1
MASASVPGDAKPQDFEFAGRKFLKFSSMAPASVPGDAKPQDFEFAGRKLLQLASTVALKEPFLLEPVFFTPP